MITSIQDLIKLGEKLRKEEIKTQDKFKFIIDVCHEKLEEAPRHEHSIERLLEDNQYEKVISRLKFIIESLEGGYCRILNKLENLYEITSSENNHF